MATRKVTQLPVEERNVVNGGDIQTGQGLVTRQPINLIVIHTMDGSWQSADQRFNDPASQVSAHYGITVDGNIKHWVDEDIIAWHAGNAQVNARSIGIEHEDLGKPNDPRPDALYATSSRLVADICKFYGLPADTTHIQPHRNFTATACPDALDINHIIAGAAQILETGGETQMIDPQDLKGNIVKFANDPTVYFRFNQETFTKYTNNDFGDLQEIPNPLQPLVDKQAGIIQGNETQISSLKAQLATAQQPTMPTATAPGNQTSEGKNLIISQVVSFLVGIGVLTLNQGNELIMVLGLLLAIGAPFVGSVVNHVDRTNLKIASLTGGN